MGCHNIERSKVISVVTWIDYVLRSLTWLFVAIIQDSRASKDVFPSGQDGSVWWILVSEQTLRITEKRVWEISWGGSVPFTWNAGAFTIGS